MNTFFRLSRSTSAAVLIVFALLPAVACAHAFPQKSDPAVGATIAKSPPTVRIWFNSYLEPLFNKLVVKNAAGKVVSHGKATVDAKDRSLLEVELPSLPPGTYHVYWRVTSKDGHHTEGDYTFTVSGH
ncbi:MAG TPA: copper resistance CopC family protein [Gammaproteobacteria bacterium]|nr:copper resistance CopC family protein [Gammaproteobacteria bacterium]